MGLLMVFTLYQIMPQATEHHRHQSCRSSSTKSSRPRLALRLVLLALYRRHLTGHLPRTSVAPGKSFISPELSFIALASASLLARKQNRPCELRARNQRGNLCCEDRLEGAGCEQGTMVSMTAIQRKVLSLASGTRMLGRRAAVMDLTRCRCSCGSESREMTRRCNQWMPCCRQRMWLSFRAKWKYVRKKGTNAALIECRSFAQYIRRQLA